MNKYIIIILSFFLAAGYSCTESTEEETQRSGANSIYATFEDGSGFFNPETASPYGDTIKFIFSTHFPAESDHVIDITRMSLKAYSPVSVMLPDGSEFVDLTKQTTITVVQTDGTKKQCVVKGVIRKSSEAQIKEFSLPSSNLPGFVIEQSKTVGLVSGGIDLTSQKPKVTLAPHSTISPDTSLVQDFSKPFTYTVTAENGTKAIYTVKPITPQKLASGLRKESGRLLWKKTLPEMGIDGANHMSTSIAISKGNLVVNTRNENNKYFDRFTGKFLGQMTMGDIHLANLKNFFSTNDDAGNILISNLTTAAGQDLFLYKWKGVNDITPEKLVQWKVDIVGSQAGRKVSVKGDLNGDALIYMGASKSNNTIYRWQVKGGVVQSQAPEKIIYPGAKKWDLYADVVPVGTSASDKVYISGYPSDMVCTDLASGEIFGQVNLAAAGYGYNHSIDLATFNKAQYLSAISISTLSGFSILYDVTNPALLSTLPTSPDYSKVCILKTETMTSLANGNGTGDVLLKVSDDGYKMILYVFVTNGGVAAYEFDCIDVDKL